MGESTAIEWADHTFNPWLGCSRVSPACRHCYAEAWAKRSGLVQWGDNAERRVTSDAAWFQPVKWNRQAEREGVRRRVFCASLADVFDDRPELVEPRARLFELIAATPNLDWLLLTKRPENILRLVPPAWLGPTGDEPTFGLAAARVYWPANVWVGTTVEDQERADERVPELLDVPAPVRFLSCEPLLGPVELRDEWLPVGFTTSVDYGTGVEHDLDRSSAVDWIIAGGESGGGARPMHPAWARQLRDTATSAGVPFLFKQWGEWSPAGRVGKKKAGRELDGRSWDEVPS